MLGVRLKGKDPSLRKIARDEDREETNVGAYIKEDTICWQMPQDLRLLSLFVMVKSGSAPMQQIEGRPLKVSRVDGDVQSPDHRHQE
jgi:hypothetical protein